MAQRLPPASDVSPRARRVLGPIQTFMHTETSSGIVLGLAAVAALVWANAWPANYDGFWHTELSISVGDWSASTYLQKFVKDGLMTLFFLVVGLEIKREVTVGELADRRLAVVPACAALGGMLVPAGIYAAFNAGGAGSGGWGIPMATDIAFALGVLALLRRAVPGALPAFLLGVAVIDDIGAILVIAAFYSSGVSASWLALAFAALVVVWLLFHWRVRLVVPYVVVGIAVWAAMANSGVSPTLAGVLLGLLAPSRAWAEPYDAAGDAARVTAEMAERNDHAPDSLATWRRVDDLGRQAVPLAERIETVLHPWSAFVVLPLFAVAFAGVPITGDSLRDAAGSPVAWGIVLGLVVGKLVGVFLGTLVPVKAGWGALPRGVGWVHVAGVSVLAGIGFTVSVFVASLAFAGSADLIDRARIAVIGASVLAGALGAGLLWLARDRRGAADGS
ncbi:MAG: Na+/H+ antiporter NhaA [Thermoleophilia bacterium]|nr:Na+/H+ antiporter NhaA [Thermoleophilia bacterium]